MTTKVNHTKEITRQNRALDQENKRLRCELLQSQKQCEDLKAQLHNLKLKTESICDSYRQDLTEARRQRDEAFMKSHKEFSNEECWMWQGDGYDNLQSLVCPVVIRPEDLQAIINRAERIAELMESDPHTFINRHCQTCSSISSLTGRLFGCIAREEKTKPLNPSNMLDTGHFSGDVGRRS